MITEAIDSAGCQLLADAFHTAGYHVAYPTPENGDCGVRNASKITGATIDFGGRSATYPPEPLTVFRSPGHRTRGLSLLTQDGGTGRRPCGTGSQASMSCR